MTESNGTSNPTAMFDTWLKSVNDFWSNMPVSFPPDAEDAGNNKTNGVNFWKAGMETWQSIASSAMNFKPPEQPSSSEMGTFHEMFSKMAEPVFASISQMIQQFNEQPFQFPDGVQPFSFDAIDADVLKIWKNLYDNEFRKYFKAPQLGLTREHQEKVAQFLDRFNILSSTMAEFLNFLTIPFKKANTDFQKKMTGLASENKLPKDTNEYYRIWLKSLEGHYMTLFQSPDYISALGKTLSASAAYTRAKKELVNDLLQQLSIPSSEHMDAVYKELHGLKKRMKNLEKAVNNR